jgi:hypothetical protein
MKMTMVDRQTLPNDPKRLVWATLRAKKSFQGRPTNGFVKVEVEEDNRQGRLYFAKCEAFFRDSRGDHYVGLRWLDQAGPCALNTTVRLPRLKLRQSTMPRSHSVLPASSVHNGALLIAVEDFYWAVMSPREPGEYVRVNTTSYHRAYLADCSRTNKILNNILRDIINCVFVRTLNKYKNCIKIL